MPVGQLPVLAGISPAELCGRAPGLALARLAMDQDPLLHAPSPGGVTQPRRESRRPFATSGKDLLLTALPGETGAHWMAGMWSAGWRPSDSGLRECIVSSSRSCPGSGLPQQALGGLRAGVGRFGAGVWGWGLSGSPACDCGAGRQTVVHIIAECPLLSSTGWSPWLD